MNMTSRALAVSLLSGVFLLTAQVANAQNTAPPPATASRPSSPDQTSVPNSRPPASRTQTTGQDNQDPKIQQMNQKEKDKVERGGK
jgi:cytoskeletal protein RodZ